MFQVGVKNSFKARHYLRGADGGESLPHEHEYVVEWRCSTNTLDENGFSVDISLMEESLGQLVEQLRGKSLNDLEFFKEREVTVENLALYLHKALFAALERRGFHLDSIREARVKIWESESAWAAYLYS